MTDVDLRPRGAHARALSASRLLSDVCAQLNILVTLAQADLRSRYGRGGFRIVKWLLDPLALLGVYLVLVTFVLDRPGAAPL